MATNREIVELLINLQGKSDVKEIESGLPLS